MPTLRSVNSSCSCEANKVVISSLTQVVFYIATSYNIYPSLYRLMTETFKMNLRFSVKYYHPFRFVVTEVSASWCLTCTVKAYFYGEHSQ